MDALDLKDGYEEVVEAARILGVGVSENETPQYALAKLVLELARRADASE